jgi:hypothetical protein
MATKKTSTAVAVRKSTAGNIVSIQEALKAQAAGINERIAPGGGSKIRITQDKKFILPDGTKTDGPLELVVVDFVTTHNFYETAFDKNNIVPPGCFAIGVNPKEMIPSKNSPNLQSDSCQGCPMNEFQSAANGKGKACSNNRLLAVLPPDATEDTPLWLLSVSATALRAFDGYVQSIVRAFGMPPIAVVTTVGFNDAADYPQLTFSDPKPNDQLDVAYARQAEARDLLMTEPDVSGYQAPTTRGKGAPAKKAVARR